MALIPVLGLQPSEQSPSGIPATNWFRRPSVAAFSRPVEAIDKGQGGLEPKPGRNHFRIEPSAPRSGVPEFKTINTRLGIKSVEVRLGKVEVRL